MLFVKPKKGVGLLSFLFWLLTKDFCRGIIQLPIVWGWIMAIILIIVGIICLPYILAIFLYLLSFIVCCVGCLGYLCTTAQEYPMVERIRQGQAIVYNGEKYFHFDGNELGTEIFVQGEMVPTASIYAPYVGIFPKILQLEASELDAEKNFLTYYGGIYVKEDFRAVAEWDTQVIASVSVGYPESDDAKIVSGLGEGLTYWDMVESEKTSLYIDYAEMWKAYCYCDVAEYDYWLFGGFSMIERDGVMYLTMSQEQEKNTDDGCYVNDCYQVKAEYQEAFKIAFDAYTSKQLEAV